MNFIELIEKEDRERQARINKTGSIIVFIILYIINIIGVYIGIYKQFSAPSLKEIKDRLKEKTDK